MVSLGFLVESFLIVLQHHAYKLLCVGSFCAVYIKHISNVLHGMLYAKDNTKTQHMPRAK